MKTITKTLSLFIAIFAVGATLVSAQVTDNPSIAIAADIQLSHTATVVQGTLDFGTLNPGDTGASIDPAGGTAGGAGKIHIAANSGQIQIDWAVTTPTNADGATLTFNPDINGSTTDDPAGSSDITNGSTPTLSGSGDFYIYIGGDLAGGTIPANQEAGAYNGSIDFTITYL